MDEAKKNPYKFIHVSIIEQLRKKLPRHSKLKLYPFSLKKGANIHGIIFGASHIRAVDKFLTIAWERNEDNGQANFDIFDNASVSQIDMFSGQRGRSRIESFQDMVRAKILNLEIKNNFDLYNYSMDQGFLGSHAADCVKLMKKQNQLTYDGGFPLVNYQNVYKKPKKISYALIK
jgi:exosome complex RNA-binding protein Csl4